ncbi:hypothetical protein ACFQ1L_11640 [Phytohabitans flavus]|uniref:hypothetical protein n=1 Tax=Phytohabitans flavus TaxID=1076124 RepID=UPI003635BE9D
MKMLHDLGEALAPPAAGDIQPPPDLRRRVLTAARERRRPRLAVRTRLAWRLGAVGAGVVAFAVLLAPNLHRADDPPPNAGETSDAASVLRLAAQTSAALPAPARDDKFVFMETVDFMRVGRILEPGREPQRRLEGPQLKYTWWPVDPARNDGYFKMLPPSTANGPISALPSTGLRRRYRPRARSTLGARRRCCPPILRGCWPTFIARTPKTPAFPGIPPTSGRSTGSRRR